MFGAHKADQGRAVEQARPPGYHLKAAIGFIEEQAHILGSETVPQLVEALRARLMSVETDVAPTRSKTAEG